MTQLSLLSWRDNADRGRIDRMALYEVTLMLDREFPNPYDPDLVEVIARVALPDGSRVDVSGFWCEDYTRHLRQGQEILRVTHTGAWKVRFTPRRIGAYNYEIKVIDHSADGPALALTCGPFGFTAVPSCDPGFLRVSVRDAAYLEFEDGQPFCGMGHNLCGWEWGGTDNRRGTFEYDEWLGALADHGANMAQFDFCEGDQLEWTNHPLELPFSNDWRGLIHYNQQTAWKMDHRIERAEELGIYVRLTLLHWEDFDNETEGFPDWGWNRNPYRRENGGPVRSVSEFFSDAAARSTFKKLLRYIVARWGYAKSILAFELWNEVDAQWMMWGEGQTYELNAENVADWHREMASYLKEIDPNRHLVTTSFEHTYNGDLVWPLPAIDLTTFHRYTYFNPVYGDEQFEAVETLHRLIVERLSRTHKPVLAGEFALSPGGDVQKEDDPHGVAFHQQLWISVLSKSLGTAMHWTWGSYIHAERLYYHYHPLSRFLADEDLRNSIPFNNVERRDAPILYLGLSTTDRAWVWLQDRGHTFASVRTGYTPVPIRGQSLDLQGLRDGWYVLDFFDTSTGGLIAQQVRASQASVLRIDLPPVTGDIALKVQRRGHAIPWVSRDIGEVKRASLTDIVGKRMVVKAGGIGVGAHTDQFRYVFAPTPGNFTLSARIDGLTNLGETVRSGLMARGSLAPDAPFVYLSITPTGQVSLMYRDVSGIHHLPSQTAAFYMWFKLQRRANTLTGAVSRDGATWEGVGDSLAVDWEAPTLVGLAVSSKDPITYVQSEFYDAHLSTV